MAKENETKTGASNAAGSPNPNRVVLLVCSDAGERLVLEDGDSWTFDRLEVPAHVTRAQLMTMDPMRAYELYGADR